ncbi:MAG: response regulator, partial [Deltaproteobacteria bacterium]|nr:response regulator [Deltaproteobacteria bacterium]
MGTKARVLVVDDEPGFRKTLSDILRAKGYAAVSVDKGKTALEMAKDENPIVALIDLRLEDMSGLEVMREIKQRSPATQCIVLTGHASQASAIEAVNLGAYSYMHKPYDVEQLMVTIRRAIEKREVERALRESETKYRLLIHNLPNIVFKGYRDWSVHFIDDKIDLLTGYKKEEFDSRKMNWADIVVKEDIEKIKKIFLQALKTDKSYVREYRIITKTGDILWIQEGSQIVCDGSGEIEFITGAFLDITERKRAEKKIHDLAYYDGVTRLPNRQLFREHLSLALAHAKRH